MSIKFIVDSGSDIVNNTRDDITVLPLMILFGDDEYLDGVEISHEEFYNRLIESETMPSTSQVSPQRFLEAFEATETEDEIIVITISSKLSGTYNSATIAAQDCNRKIYLVDSENVTLGQRSLVDLAVRLKDQGLSAKEIVEQLEIYKKKLHVIALLDTLEYLKRGGRISKTVAFAGGILSIKPVISVREGEVELIGKARGSKQGNNYLAQEIESAGGIDFSKPYYLGYTGVSDALLQKYIEDSKQHWEKHTSNLNIMTVGGAIGTHAGPGAIAVAFFEKD